MTNARTNKILLEYDDALRGKEDDVIRRVNSILSDSYDKLERQLRAQWTQLPDNLLPTQRALILEAQLKELLPLVSPSKAAITNEFRNLLTNAYTSGVEFGTSILDASSPDGFALATTKPNLTTITAAADHAYTYMVKYGTEFAQRVTALVGLKLTLGHGVAKTARAMRNELGITQAKAEQLVRTESITAYVASTRKVYQDNNIEYVRWDSTADVRVCPYCAARNMSIYRINEVLVPAHPSCRCNIAPYRKDWDELGLVDHDLESKLYDEGLKQLEADGRQPNRNVTPFEKAAGLTTAPTPFKRPTRPT